MNTGFWTRLLSWASSPGLLLHPMSPKVSEHKWTLILNLISVLLPLNLNTHPLEGTGTLVYQGLTADGGKLQTTDKQYSAVHFSPPLRVIHPFFCRWTVLFFLICSFWHVNGAADGLAFWTDRREDRGYWVYCVPSTKEWQSPLSRLTSLCRSFPCFLFSFILPTQFLCLIICFRLPGCAFGEIHLDSFPFSCSLKHLPNNWPAAAREIAASTRMNFDLLAKVILTNKYKCKITTYCKHKHNKYYLFKDMIVHQSMILACVCYINQGLLSNSMFACTSSSDN